MAFTDFKYPDVVQQFGLAWHTVPDLFAGVPPVAPSPLLTHALTVGASLAVTVNTEKGRSEWIIAPLLTDFWERYASQISLFSGSDFQADPGAKLTGFCDFLIGRAPQQPVIIAPVVVICEAKKDSPDSGLGQCIAAMVGAQRFNQRARARGRDPRVPHDRERVAVLAADRLGARVRRGRVRPRASRPHPRHPHAHRGTARPVS